MPDSTYRRNFVVLTADGLLFFLGMIFISYESVLPVFLARLGAPRTAIAIVPVAVAIGVNMPSLLAAPLVEAAASKRRYILRHAVWQRVPWLLIALLIPLLAPGNAGLLIVLLLLSVLITTVSGGFVIPAFFDIIASTIPVERRGTLFALRSVLSYLFGIGGGLIVRLVLDHVSYPLDYSVLYGIATLVLFGGWVVFSFVREPERAPAAASAPRGRLPKGHVVQRIRVVLGTNRSFRAYIIARGLLVLAFATTSFFPVYLVEEFGLPDSASGVFAMITAATFVLVNPIFGRIGNTVGYKPVFLASYISLGVAAVVGLSGLTAPWSYVLIVCTAVSHSVNLLSWNMTVEFAPEGQVPSYIGVSGFFIGVVAPLGVLLGSVVDLFGFTGLFVVTALFAVAGFAVMAWGVEEPRAIRRRLNQPDLPI